VSLVLDASLTLSWYFDDEVKPAADAVLERVGAKGAIVPSLWRMEVANALQVALRRKRIDKEFRGRAIRHLEALPIAVDRETDTFVWSATLGLADRFDLTVYDAAYLELAHRRNLPLATLDKELIIAARALGVPTVGRGREVGGHQPK
jgi:predicted nucleic acid-binding protein